MCATYTFLILNSVNSLKSISGLVPWSSLRTLKLTEIVPSEFLKQ